MAEGRGQRKAARESLRAVYLADDGQHALRCQKHVELEQIFKGVNNLKSAFQMLIMFTFSSEFPNAISSSAAFHG
jgi:hypothetical protein